MVVLKFKVWYTVLYSLAHFWEIMSFEYFTLVLPTKWVGQALSQVGNCALTDEAQRGQVPPPRSCCQ